MTEKAREDVKDIICNLAATQGAEYAKIVALSARVIAVLGMIQYLPGVPDDLRGTMYEIAADLMSEMIALLVDGYGLPSEDIRRWTEIVVKKGYL